MGDGGFGGFEMVENVCSILMWGCEGFLEF